MRAALKDHAAAGLDIARGLVVGTVLGTQHIVFENDLHVAFQGVDVSPARLLPRLDGDLLGKPSICPRGRGDPSARSAGVPGWKPDAAGASEVEGNSLVNADEISSR